ncbi:MAG: hypothetical protein KC897_08655 [Candidatus Omnitrophica bacterium]|nr:hypothetical protein [Candidatus Omnitrophota bacterium]MCB9720243.1 hypothetical protein [Candidatus Omnitrophota bacterium]
MPASEPHNILDGLTATNKVLAIILAIGLALGVLWGVFAGGEMMQTAKREAITFSLIRSVTTALDTYFSANNRYPPALMSLLESDARNPPYVSPRTLEFPGYAADYGATPGGYVLRLAPADARGLYFYVDQSGVIRGRRGSPADAGSPEWRR